MTPAILINNKVVTGTHHGDAFSKLSEDEKNEQLLSGFIDSAHLKFVTDDATIYLKEMILIRHAQSDLRIDNGPITHFGRNQAFRLARFLNDLHIENYQGFSSPYIRCQQTSAIIKEICCLPFEVNPCLSKCNIHETPEEFQERIVCSLDSLPPKFVLVTHTDFIENVLNITNLTQKNLKSIRNCSITYICQNRLIWLAKDI